MGGSTVELLDIELPELERLLATAPHKFETVILGLIQLQFMILGKASK